MKLPTGGKEKRIEEKGREVGMKGGKSGKRWRRGGVGDKGKEEEGEGGGGGGEKNLCPRAYRRPSGLCRCHCCGDSRNRLNSRSH